MRAEQTISPMIAVAKEPAVAIAGHFHERTAMAKSYFERFRILRARFQADAEIRVFSLQRQFCCVRASRELRCSRGRKRELQSILPIKFFDSLRQHFLFGKYQPALERQQPAQVDDGQLPFKPLKLQLKIVAG